jgi:hypothetical protein
MTGMEDNLTRCDICGKLVRDLGKHRRFHTIPELRQKLKLFEKGHTPWNKGLKLPNEIVERMRERKLQKNRLKREAALILLKAGWATPQIAEVLSVSRVAVQKWVKKQFVLRCTHQPTIKIPEEEEFLRYIAGLFDGEGCISVHINRTRWGHYLKAWIAIVNTNREVIDSLLAHFGGHLYVREYINPKYKTCYYWYFYGLTNVVSFLQKLLPFLVIKKEKALKTIEIIGKYLSTPRGQRGTFLEKYQHVIDELRAYAKGGGKRLIPKTVAVEVTVK